MSQLIVDRRAILKSGALWLFSANASHSIASPRLNTQSGGDEALVSAGLITDVHYADKPTAGTRFYRDSIEKIQSAGEFLNESPVNFCVELGDLIDAADSVSTELQFLNRINREFEQFPGEKHFVLGNHCVSTLTKPEFLEEVEREESFYSFDENDVHFIILDACFRADGEPYGRNNFEWTDPNIPDEQLEWLAEDLASTESATVVFVHQRLDVDNHYAIRNAAQVRTLLEESGNVLAVFQGHSHSNDHRQINGIHYCTVVAMVEQAIGQSNSAARIDVFRDGLIRVEGFANQSDYEWSTAATER